MIISRFAAAFCATLALAAAPAGAVVFGPGTPQGFVTQLSGASSFGLPDANLGSITCPLCDSTVNFATFSNPNQVDWRPLLNVNPTFLSGFDVTARWVFLYQIENTDPLNVTNAQLENFNVTTTFKDGTPSPSNKYSSGGFINANDLVTFNSVAPLDVPNDWLQSDVSAREIAISATDDVDPTQLLFTNASGPNPIASAAINAGGSAYAGALFEFTSPLIGAGGFSDVLFLTSNAPHASIVWAETESPGGFGAAGDVAGIKARVPVPASLFLMLPVIAGLGLMGRRKASA